MKCARPNRGGRRTGARIAPEFVAAFLTEPHEIGSADGCVRDHASPIPRALRNTNSVEMFALIPGNRACQVQHLQPVATNWVIKTRWCTFAIESVHAYIILSIIAWLQQRRRADARHQLTRVIDRPASRMIFRFRQLLDYEMHSISKCVASLPCVRLQGGPRLERILTWH